MVLLTDACVPLLAVALVLLSLALPAVVVLGLTVGAAANGGDVVRGGAVVAGGNWAAGGPLLTAAV